MVYDMEKLYVRLPAISQKMDVELQTVFQHELSQLRSSLIDEYEKNHKNHSGEQHLLPSAESYLLGSCVLELVDGDEALYTNGDTQPLFRSFA